MRFFRMLRSMAPRLAREGFEELYWNTVQSSMFPDSKVQTGLPTAGGTIFTLMKEVISKFNQQEKKLFEGKLLAMGMSQGGAKALTEGTMPTIKPDLIVLASLHSWDDAPTGSFPETVGKGNDKLPSQFLMSTSRIHCSLLSLDQGASRHSKADL